MFYSFCYRPSSFLIPSRTLYSLIDVGPDLLNLEFLLASQEFVRVRYVEDVDAAEHLDLRLLPDPVETRAWRHLNVLNNK